MPRLRLFPVLLWALLLPGFLKGMDPLKSVSKKWETKADFERCTTDGNIAIADDGARLRKMVFLQDEQGMTHYNNVQALSASVWAKKQFLIEDPACEKAELFAFGASGAKVACNGKELKEGKPLPFTRWTVWEVPPGALKQGLNDFVFSGGGQLLIESSLSPDRSALSTDGGKTWDFDHLGMEGVENGEWVVRLRLAQYPQAGLISSQVVDLLRNEKGIAPPARLTKVQAKVIFQSLTDPSIPFEIRSGATPAPDNSWSPWKAVFKESRNAARAAKSVHQGEAECHRWAQWRVKLATNQPNQTSRLERVELIAEWNGKDDKAVPAVQILELTPVEIARRSQPFAHQAPFHRLKQLRERYKLDEVIAPGKTELEKIVLLREWVRQTAPKGWDAGVTQWVPPWDALVILETNNPGRTGGGKEPLALCMCTHFSTVFVQCALALGWNARQLILDHHCAAEIWSNQFRKWMVMDTGNSTDPTLNCHFERAGVPLNAVEIRRLWKADRVNEMEVVYTPPRGRVPGPKISENQCGFGNYRRFAIPFRNNHMVTPFPGEPEQGESDYYCDQYLWWEEQAVPVESPEYGKTTCRFADFYWTLNETAIHLQASEAADALKVDLETVTPNFDKFLVSFDGGKWEAKAASFDWKLHPGENKLQVKAVNQLGIEGPESLARVAFSPSPVK